MGRKKYEMDMCRGPLTGKVIWYSLPLMTMMILQLAFNAMDMVVIGRFAAHESLAAIGSTGNIIGLVIHVFGGLTIGTSVLTAQYYGAGDFHRMRKCVHSSIGLAIYGGIVLTIAGEFAARPMIRLVGIPENVQPEAYCYLWIFFLATPFIMLSNFGASVLRSVGDTRRPLYFFVISGVVNVVLNLFFVIVCGMTVGGVAVATVISHMLAAGLIVRTLVRSRGGCRLVLSQAKPEWNMCREILKIGVPAGVQSSAFCISNLTIDSVVNSFGSMAMAGSAATVTLEGMVYISSAAYHQTTIAFVGQNYGGKKYDRIFRSFVICAVCGAFFCFLTGMIFLVTGRELLSLFTRDPEVLAWGWLRMRLLFPLYFLCAFMDVTSGALRGLGYSMLSSLSSVVGACGTRLLWIWLVLPLHRTFTMLFIGYPVSWILVTVFSGYMLWRIWQRKLLPLQSMAVRQQGVPAK